MTGERPAGRREPSVRGLAGAVRRASEQVQVRVGENILGRGNKMCRGPELGEEVASFRDGEWKEMTAGLQDGGSCV